MSYIIFLGIWRYLYYLSSGPCEILFEIIFVRIPNSQLKSKSNRYAPCYKPKDDQLFDTANFNSYNMYITLCTYSHIISRT